jgi:2,4-dienoyl-CoA reductase-like NADH-dependent reductase (Old Yellow Enzyme family)
VELLLILIAAGYGLYKVTDKASEEAKKRAEALRTKPTPVPKHPEPTPEPSAEERAAAAKKRYDDAVRMLDKAGLDPVELSSAKLKAHMAYLKELDKSL